MRHPLSFGRYDGKNSPPVTPAAMARLHLDVAAAKGQKLSAVDEAMLLRQAGANASSTSATVHSIQPADHEPDLAEAVAAMTGEPMPKTIKLGGVEYTRQTPKMKTIRSLLPPMIALWKKRQGAGEKLDGAANVVAVVEEIANSGKRGEELSGALIADVYGLAMDGPAAFAWWENLPCDEAATAMEGVAASVPFGKLLASFTNAVQAGSASISSVTGGK